MQRSTVVLTIGHSNRSLEEFIALLEAHGVECLVAVRSIPWSRHNPQFNREIPSRIHRTTRRRLPAPAGAGRPAEAEA